MSHEESEIDADSQAFQSAVDEQKPPIRPVFAGTIGATGARADQDHIMQFFRYDHLPEELQATSQLFYQLAKRIVDGVPRNPERTVALRKLLEGKDAAVRAVLAK